MPNPKYIKGKRAEYSCIKTLLDQGCKWAQRSAGSHSPVDVWGIDVENKIIRLVQVKAGVLTEKQKEILMLDNKDLQGDFKVSFEVWSLGEKE